jgi:DNA-binding XRE family transcriptional regulator
MNTYDQKHQDQVDYQAMLFDVIDRIKYLRCIAGWTQGTVNNRMGYTYQKTGAIETGMQSYATALRLANRLEKLVDREL